MEIAQFLGNLGEFIGAVVIIASLIYLAMQIKQNTNALHADSRVAILTGGHVELMAMMENPVLVSSIVKSGPLTQDEQIGLSAILYATMRTREFAWGQFRAGVIDEAQWGTEVNVIQFIFDSQRTRQWWQKLGRAAFNTEFSDFVELLMRDKSPTDTLWESYTNWATSKAKE